MLRKGRIKIREIRETDCEVISNFFKEQDWIKPKSQYKKYLEYQKKGERDILILEKEGEFAGYLTIIWESGYEEFKKRSIPEIVDLNVLKKYQREGLGTILMDEAERRIKEISNYVGIGFGITEDYGAAQQLYINRNYKPDGKGLRRNTKRLNYGDLVKVDDDLAIYLIKELRRNTESYISRIRKKLGSAKIIYPGSRILIENEKGEILFIKRQDTGKLGIPAGGIEEGETIEECIKREVKEETGLELLKIELIGISTDPEIELVKYPNGDEVQYFTIEFYSNKWKGKLNIDSNEEVNKVEFKSKKYIDELPINEKGILESYKYYQKEKKIRLK